MIATEACKLVPSFYPPQTPFPPSLQKEKQLLISKLLLLVWNDLSKDLFLWSAVKSCLGKLYSQTQIRTYAQVTWQRYDSLPREKLKFDVCNMHICLYVHKSCGEKCTISSTMGTLCYEMWHIVLFVINILYILHSVSSPWGVNGVTRVILFLLLLFWCSEGSSLRSCDSSRYILQLIFLCQINLTVLCSFKRILRWPRHTHTHTDPTYCHRSWGETWANKKRLNRTCFEIQHA